MGETQEKNNTQEFQEVKYVRKKVSSGSKYTLPSKKDNHETQITKRIHKKHRLGTVMKKTTGGLKHV